MLDTITISAKAHPIYRASAPRIWEMMFTRVALSFNLPEKTANGEEWVRMHPYFYPTDSLTLDAKSMEVYDVKVVGQNNALQYTYKDDKIKVKFNHAYKAGDTIELYVKYKAMPYATSTGGSNAITEDRGLYFINTDNKVKGKPVQIWTQGETESNSHWLPTVDKPNNRFRLQTELTVPDSFVTLGNGYLAKSTKEKNGLRTDIWKMDQPIQAYVAMFAIGKFDIVKDQWRGRDVNYYVEHEYAPYARKMFNNTPEMIEYFSKITGVTYPWNKYDQVVVRDYVSGAMENTTASLFGEFMNQDNREIADANFEDVVSHELFHMWFGDYVTCESWSNITVNESFANYGEQLWRRHKYGDVSADKEAYNDLRKYLQYSEHADPSLVRFHYDDREETFDPISYEKGGATLRYLNYMIGDSAFYRAINLYLSKNALHSAEATQWRLAVEEATGLDWNWFFNEWYYHPGHPVLKVEYKDNDSLQHTTVTVTQAQDDTTFKYDLPLKTAVIYGNEKTIVDWRIQDRKEVFIYPYKNGVKPTIVADYYRVLPGSLKETKTMDRYLVQMQQAKEYVNQDRAISAATFDMGETQSPEIIDLGLNSPTAEVRERALVAIDGLKSDKWKDKWKSKIEYIAINDNNNNVRAAAFGILGNWKDASQEDLMLTAIHDSSYNVAGTALKALAKIDSDKAYTISKQMLATHPRGNLMYQAWYIIGKKGREEDYVLFRDAAPHFYGNIKFQLAAALLYYEENVKNIITFEQGLDIFRQMIADENIKSYRVALVYYVAEVGRHFVDEKGEDAKNRVQMVKNHLQKIIDTETDPSNITDYKNLMSNTFPEPEKKEETKTPKEGTTK